MPGSRRADRHLIGVCTSSDRGSPRQDLFPRLTDAEIRGHKIVMTRPFCSRILRPYQHGETGPLPACPAATNATPCMDNRPTARLATRDHRLHSTQPAEDFKTSQPSFTSDPTTLQDPHQSSKRTLWKVAGTPSP
ncbi:uncharacterized protein [Dermacentor albipictus]|uniref:uncharacterized protein n=1 Tax=Dermacentor albipictus TaxID=60249 RepID=UPI0038FC75A9